jgi:hypothetical protein
MISSAHYSGFQMSYHTVSSLRLLIPNSLQVCCHFFFQSVGTELLEVVGASTVPVHLSCRQWGGRQLLHNVLSLIFRSRTEDPGRRRLNLKGPFSWRRRRSRRKLKILLLALQSPTLVSAWGPHWVISCLQEVAADIYLSLLSRQQRRFLVPNKLDIQIAQGRHGG